MRVDEELCTFCSKCSGFESRTNCHVPTTQLPAYPPFWLVK